MVMAADRQFAPNLGQGAEVADVVVRLMGER